MVTISIELPDELVDLLGSPDALAAQSRQSLVLDLLRKGQISQGKAATLLGITRWDILELMARYQIMSGPLTAEEAQRDVEAARAGVIAAPTHAGG